MVKFIEISCGRSLHFYYHYRKPFIFSCFSLGSYGLARVAVVDENLKTLYHTYVKPDVAIADYLTMYSGITEELLKDVKKTPSDVQQDLRSLLPPDAILVGQSLQSDLKALKVRF